MTFLFRARAVGIAAVCALPLGCRDDAPSGGGDGSTGGGGETGTPEPTSATDDGSGTDETGSETGEPMTCPEVRVADQPLRRITRAQYHNSMRDILGVEVDVEAIDDDEKAGPFDANSSAPVSNVSVEQYRLLAETVGTDAMAATGNFLPCSPADASCDDDFVRDVGRLIYRRPLTDAEIEEYLELFALGEDFDNGVRLVVQGMLQSANFLYHLEFGLPDPVGDKVVALGGYELASRLSFFLWNSAPDLDLLESARVGDLDSPEGLRAEAERLLEDTRAREAIANFHVQWLGVDELPEVLKDTDLYPDFDSTMKDAMADETRRFTQVVLLQGDGKLETLLTAPYSYIDGPLFDLYGVEEPPGHNAGQRVDLNPNQRAGLLTQAAFLATHAHANQSGPIQRGFSIRASVLCDPPPPPPPTVNAIPPIPQPDATTREIFEMHTAAEECATCHLLIDGVGLGFEGYDAVGAYRTMENGLPVDESGELVATDVDGEFDGVVELAEKLSSSQQVRECVSRQWFRYAFGRIEADEDECSLDVLDAAFADSDYNVRELLIGIVQTDAFRHRAVD